jgi:membrane fusion protein, multidrug efflux system
MTKLSRLFLTLLASGLILGGVAFIMSQPAPAPVQKGGRFGSGDGPVPVRVAAATTADVPVFLETVGTARALNTVAVQPQVGGKLIEVAYREGQTVEKGQILARIDPTTYQAALEQARAKQAQDESQLANARVDLERYMKIPGTVAIKTVDTQRALVTQLTGQVAGSKAAVAQAEVQLAFTNIIAPTTGRTGIRQVDEGNIVTGSGQTIVTITQVQPIGVIFNLPQQQLAQVNRAAALGTVVVQATDTDNKTVVDMGRLLVVDNQVDQTTGTVKMKAEFPNTKLQLWPGQFINVRLLIETMPQVVTVPTAAVQRGPAGTFIYVAGADNRVTVRAVTVPQQDDVRAVVAGDVQAGDQVVTTGFARLKEGTEVAVATTEQLDAAPVAPKRESPRENRRKRDGAGGAPGAASGDGETKGEGRRGGGDGRRKRDGNAPSVEAPQPAGPSAGAPSEAPSGAPGKRAQQAPQAAAQ